jgi:hypothetical protein
MILPDHGAGPLVGLLQFRIRTDHQDWKVKCKRLLGYRVVG